MIARFWPVTGVVGENGAFYFTHDAGARKMTRVFAAPAAERAANRARLQALGEHILAQVPGAAIAADQLYRETDLAIDFCEDVAPLTLAVSKSCPIAQSARAGRSTIRPRLIRPWSMSRRAPPRYITQACWRAPTSNRPMRSRGGFTARPRPA